MPETLQGDRVREGSETIWSAPILGVKSGEGDPALGEKMGCKNGADRKRVLLNAGVDQTSVNPEPIV